MNKNVKAFVFLTFLSIGFLGNFSLASTSKVLDFKFYDAGQKSYHSTTLRNDLKSQFGSAHSPMLMLIQTQSLEDQKYLRQSKISGSLDAETLGFLIVTACSSEVYKDGYHTDIATAKTLLKDRSEFQVILLDDRGQILSQSSQVLSAKKLKQIILKKREKV